MLVAIEYPYDFRNGSFLEFSCGVLLSLFSKRRGLIIENGSSNELMMEWSDAN